MLTGERDGDESRDEVRDREPLLCIINGAFGGRSGMSIGIAAKWGSTGIICIAGTGYTGIIGIPGMEVMEGTEGTAGIGAAGTGQP